MSGGKHLLLLAALLHLARCQNELQVTVSPELKQIFFGDFLYLTCNGTGTVKWYLNKKEISQGNKTWKITAASTRDSGLYHCESDGKESRSREIKVLEYNPSASLTLKTGQPVMRHGGSVQLQLDHDSSLEGWNCWVVRGQKKNRIKLKLNNEKDLSIVFQPNRLTVPETIFWCTDKDQELRSNQQVIRTTEKDISLEMYPQPAVVGESLTLKCLVWGTDQISRAVFYKEKIVFANETTSTHKIANVTESEAGRYKCDATYRHVGETETLHKDVSDIQDVFVQGSPIKASLSETNGLTCSCPRCEGEYSYHYYKQDDQTWKFMESTKSSMKPKESGTYACRAVMTTMRSFLSNTHSFSDQPGSSILTGVIVVIVMVLILIVAVICYKRLKKRGDTGPIYEDMPLRSRDEGGDKYEQLQTVGGKEPEYDTLQTETQGRKKEGEYEGLKKEEVKDGVYHTLGMEGGAGGGGYEALKKEGMKEGEYHTLGMEGGAGGGGYEALKKEGMKEGEYDILKMEEGAGGGGYEALKKEGMKGDEYQTLGTGAAGGEGEQEQ
ncbi:uncharacterized protein LOC121887385 [Thunnus maccoyii]|uniref:uncharacterized protein LOC121887385 n=1 Tax=Thunnus maccoyii TaxID=8240 RepID=UPI001C4CDE2A|nr:uncharacterized protein LOC121887385 [Thunnus maccoyii]